MSQLNFAIPAGEFAALVGPSGCGKTTILNLAAGLLTPTSGSIETFGQRLTGLNPNVSYLFQQDALLPWKTLEENIALAATLAGKDGLEEARRWLIRLGLDGFGHYYPAQASGGMRKRAALAQQWIPRRPLLLMDEPFSSLDIHTRQRMETELLQLWDEDPSAGKGRTLFGHPRPRGGHRARQCRLRPFRRTGQHHRQSLRHRLATPARDRRPTPACPLPRPLPPHLE